MESVNSMSFLPPLQSGFSPPLPQQPKSQINPNQIKQKSSSSPVAGTSISSKLPSQTPFKPIFGARLSSSAATKPSKESPKPPASPVYIKPKTVKPSPSSPQLRPRPSPFVHSAPIGPRTTSSTKATTKTPTTSTTSTTTTVKPSSSPNKKLNSTTSAPEDDEFDVDYIDNADERLKGVTHLNLTNEDLWHAESQAMATVLKVHEAGQNSNNSNKSATLPATSKLANETHLLASASEQQQQQATALPGTRELGLDLNNFQSKAIFRSTEVDFSTIFSSYKSPELKFDPFKVFETESSTSGSGGGSNNLFSNDPTIEYVTTDRKLSNKVIIGGGDQQQETDQPVFVPLEDNGFSRNNNNNFNGNNNNNNNNLGNDDINTRPLNTFQWSSPPPSSSFTTDRPLIITTTSSTSTNSNSPQSSSFFESSFENLPPSVFNQQTSSSPSSSSLFDRGNNQLSTTFTQNLNSNPFPAIEERVNQQVVRPVTSVFSSTTTEGSNGGSNDNGNRRPPSPPPSSTSVPSILSSFIAGENNSPNKNSARDLATYDLKKAYDNLRSVRKARLQYKCK
ncbi:hypothetical protein TYRP_022659 [Tyrophagus putrescentiae]|nr:hypothetical protein TYRP_022659 [Tyrophagus putrescentiae]